MMSLRKVYYICATLTLLPAHMDATAPFETITDLMAYAQKLPKEPKNDKTDWHNPDYSTFHRSLVPGFFDGILSWFGVEAMPIFPIKKFQQLLEKRTEEREQLYPRGRLIQKITPDPESSFFVWGELNGAFHSLVRCLQNLKILGIIDDKMKLIHKKQFLLFDGDVVGRSPYILETLMVILLLFEQNPGQVFYIKGAKEDKGRWQTGALARDLKIRAAGISSEKVPLSGLFRRFFSTLPLALYLVPPDQTGTKKEVVRISYAGAQSTELDETEYADFFDASSETITSILTKDGTLQSESSGTVRVIVHVEDRTVRYTPSQGLVLQSTEPATQWLIASSPTASYRRLYGFFYDAYTVITTAKHFSDWTIRLYRQDVRDLNGFVKGQSFQLISGKEYKGNQQEEIDRLQQELQEIQSVNEQLIQECNV